MRARLQHDVAQGTRALAATQDGFIQKIVASGETPLREQPRKNMDTRWSPVLPSEAVERAGHVAQRAELVEVGDMELYIGRPTPGESTGVWGIKGDEGSPRQCP